jgi:hypothetical protein
MEFKLNLKNIPISNEEIINDLKQVALFLKQNTVTMEEYDIHGKFNSSTIQRRFRSWFKAMELTGLENARSGFDIDDKLLLANIADVWIKLGKQPSSKDMKRPLSNYGTSTYSRHFGTWNNALIQFIKTVQKNNDDTVLEVVPQSINEKSESLENKNTKESRTISLRLRFSVFLRDGFRCQSCGKSPVTHPGIELHCDHIIPWSKDGKTNLNNLRTLCSDCNLGKGNMDESKDWI